MKHLTLFGLCSLLLLVTACNRGGCGSRCCPTTSTCSTTETTTTITQDAVANSNGTTVTTVTHTDKEALEEAELVDVMTNK